MDRDNLNRKVSLFIYKDYSTKICLAVSFFCLDISKRLRRVKKFYKIIFMLQKNKSDIDSDVSLFRNNVENYSQFFFRELGNNIQLINNEIQSAKKILFLEDKYYIKNVVEAHENNKELQNNKILFKKKKTAEFKLQESSLRNEHLNSKIKKKYLENIDEINSNNGNLNHQYQTIPFNENKIFLIEEEKRQIFKDFINEKYKFYRKDFLRKMMSKNNY